MNVVHVLRWDDAQAVRLPSHVRLDCDTVEVIQRGDEIVLRPTSSHLRRAAELIASLEDPRLA
ncbi:MAG TPA: AbrB/MazE/SpoVT family DNA-binding domain-containing protein [Candidatus Saccharimonadia bacterium]|nr:AbrB/MazE/SpoVT family DNA-binding domain-containing protein [Candidatus Saccharimonadia bacterium]